MNPSEHYFETRRKVRFYLLGEPGPQVQNIFFALHGYGYLARYFARKFESIDLSKTLVVLPEGIHRYYLDNDYKRVGASWMTKEDRLTDIGDQMIYLDGLYDQISASCPNAARTIVLGFSQGTATASRWASKSAHQFDDLILWAGALPPDLEDQEIERLRNVNLVVALGDKDEYIDEGKFQKESLRLQDLHLEHHVIRFSGNHDIPHSALQELNKILGI